MRRLLFLATALLAATACEAPGPLAPPSGRAPANVVGVFTEPAFYDGMVVHFLLPSAGSANPNEQIVAGCFRVGPTPPAGTPIRDTAFIMLIPGATQETVCSATGQPAGALSHNHVLSAAPGDPTYDGHFQLIGVGPGPHYPGPASASSYNSVTAVLAGLAAGELIIAIPDIAHTSWSVRLNP